MSSSLSLGPELSTPRTLRSSMNTLAITQEIIDLNSGSKICVLGTVLGQLDDSFFGFVDFVVYCQCLSCGYLYEKSQNLPRDVKISNECS